MIERLGFYVKLRLPHLFVLVEGIVGIVSALPRRNVVRGLMRSGKVVGTIGGKRCVLRALRSKPEDLAALHSFLNSMSEEYVRFFHPHAFSQRALRALLHRGDRVLFGLFVSDRLIAYCLLKLYPGQRAFLGLVVHPDYSGRGIGEFLWKHMHWQCNHLGYTAYCTINRLNKASLRSQAAAGSFKVIQELENDYFLLKADRVAGPLAKPELETKGKELARTQIVSAFF